MQQEKKGATAARRIPSSKRKLLTFLEDFRSCLVLLLVIVNLGLSAYSLQQEYKFNEPNPVVGKVFLRYTPACQKGPEEFSCEEATQPYFALSQYVVVPWVAYRLPPISNNAIFILFYLIELGVCLNPTLLLAFSFLGLLMSSAECALFLYFGWESHSVQSVVVGVNGVLVVVSYIHYYCYKTARRQLKE